MMTIFNIRTHNLFVLIFSVFWFVAFILLGVWQITRGFEKLQQQTSISEVGTPITSIEELLQATTAANINVGTDVSTDADAALFFKPVQLKGSFKGTIFLLDNSIYYDMVDEATDAPAANGDASQLKSPYCFLLGDCGRKNGKVRVGYRVFSLFNPNPHPAPYNELPTLLVERGWLEAAADRSISPNVIEAIPPSKELVIDAVLMPGAGQRRVLQADNLADLGPEQNLSGKQWRIIQTLDIAALADKLQLDIYPHPMIMTATSEGAMERFAPLANFSYLNPSRHFGYAVQWFLMAVALLWVYLAFYRKNSLS